MKSVNIAIVGGGVAGLTAAIYALRANAQVTIYEQSTIGGLTATIDKIDNYPSYTTIDGYTLTDNMLQQALALGLVVQYQQVISVNKRGQAIVVTTSAGENIYDSVVVATGTHHNKLGLTAEDKYVGKGLSYCATCDGNFYKNKDIVIVGSTAVAVKEAVYLSAIARKLTVISPNAQLTGDDIVLQQLLDAPNVEIMYNCIVSDIIGDERVQNVAVSNTIDNVSVTIVAEALFVAIGSKPANQLLVNCGVQLNKGFVTADSTMMSTVEGVFVAGDLHDGKLKQVITACGDGAVAGNYAVIWARATKAQSAKREQ